MFSLKSLIRVTASKRAPGRNIKLLRVKSIFIIYCLSYFAFQIHLKILVPHGHSYFVKFYLARKIRPFQAQQGQKV